MSRTASRRRREPELHDDLRGIVRGLRRRQQLQRERAVVECPDCHGGTVPRAAGTWCPYCRLYVYMGEGTDGELRFFTQGAPL